jgi:hypothetical protein
MTDNALPLDEGLSATEAMRRLAEDGPNALPGGLNRPGF